MRTREVFSFTPVSRDACAKIPSSMLSVVFIHTNMADSDVFVKHPTSAVRRRYPVASAALFGRRFELMQYRSFRIFFTRIFLLVSLQENAPTNLSCYTYG